MDLPDTQLGKAAEKDEHMMYCKAGELGINMQEEVEGFLDDIFECCPTQRVCPCLLLTCNAVRKHQDLAVHLWFLYMESIRLGTPAASLPKCHL